jgi:hypothetical protein
MVHVYHGTPVEYQYGTCTRVPFDTIMSQLSYVHVRVRSCNNYPETLLGGEVTSRGKHPRDDKRPALLALVIMGHPNAPK